MTSPIDTASVAIVPDFTGFARQARSGIDSALRGLVAEIDRAFGGTEKAATDAGQNIGAEFQKGGEAAERALREVSRTVIVVMDNVTVQTNQAASGISTKFGGALGLLKSGLAAAGVGAAVGLGAITAYGLQSAAALEQTQTAFNSLLGSVEEGIRVFDGLKKFAAITPFELPQITGAAQKFLAFNDAIGMTDAQLQPFLTTLGDVASVTGAGAEGMDRVTLALGQIASRGKVSLEEINQISEALPGFSGVAAIAAATGQTTAQAMDAISAGAISASTGVAALLKGMQTFPGAAGAMEKQSQTLLGVFSTFRDTVGQALAGGFAPVIPEIKSALTDLTPVLGEAISELAPSLGGLLADVMPLIGSLVKGIVPLLTPLLDALGPALAALGPSLGPLGEALGQVMVALAPILPLLGEFLGAALQLLVPVALLLAAVLKPLTPVIEFLTAAVAEFGKWLSTIDWAGVGSAIGGAFADAWNAVRDFFTRIGQSFSELPGKIGAALSALPEQVAAIAADLWQRVKTFFVEGTNNTAELVKSLPPRILATLKALAGQMLQVGKNIVGGLIGGIKGAVGHAVNAVKQAMGDILAAAKGALGIASPSTVFANAVGVQIPAGIEEGIRAGVPSLQALLNDVTQPVVAAGGAPAAAGSAAGLGPINITIHFSGVVPTEAEARRTGQAAGSGVADAIARRDVALAARQV